MMKMTKKNATSARSNKPAREARNPPGDSDKKQSPKAKEQRTPAASPRATSKLAQVITMLRTAKGATIEELARATNWQTHSVRGAISGAIKKKFGFVVTSERVDGVRTYRIAV